MTRKCCHCGTERGELRPYGPDGAWVCFPCAMSPEHVEETKANFVDALGRADRASNGMVALGGPNGPIPLGSKGVPN